MTSYLLDFNENCASMSCRFRVTVNYLSKIADFNLPQLHLAPPLGWPRSNFVDIFGIKKLEP